MKIYLFLLIIFISASCKPKPGTDKNFTEKEKWSDFFTEKGLNGTFVLYSMETGEYFVFNPERAKQAFLPASTFKIMNSLVALETGAITNPQEIISWDGNKYDFESWNRDQNMLYAFKNSTVWFYQELARRIGEEKMQYWVNACEYGNRNISGGIDLFWLQGELKVSAMEQVAFIKKLVANELLFSAATQQLVREIMLTDSTSAYRLYAKTGWAARVSPQIGWYTGFVEVNDETWVFALNFTISENRQIAYRIDITYDILKEHGIIPQE